MEPAFLRAIATVANSYFLNVVLIPPNPPAPPEEQKGYEGDGKKTKDPLSSFLPVSSMVTIYLAVIHSINTFELAAIAVDKIPFVHDALLRSHDTIGPSILQLLVGNRGPIYLTPEAALTVACLAVCGAVRHLCYRTLAKLFTFELALKRDHKLITDGPYSVVRHPSYTALVISIFVIGVYQLGKGSWWNSRFGGWSRLGYVAIMTVVYVRALVGRCNVEDEVLKEHFGDQWIQWSKKTPYKLIPFVW